jgi:3-hydroxyacyl-[acyl-carrier-protein] dehydratase
MAEIRLTLQIPYDHPSFAGHFPGQPIVPGVVLLDEVMQAVEKEVPQLGLFSAGTGAEIPVCKFLAPVFPGATLTLTCDGQSPLLTFKLHQATQLVASGSLRGTPTP